MKSTTRELVQSALCVALIAILAQITIPTPSGVPVTLQTFAIALCGYYQRPRTAVLTVAAYLLLGLAGIPVFSGFGGGAGVLAGLTGGFLVGFVPMAALCAGASGAVACRTAGRASVGPRVRCVLLSLLGLLCCHALGTAWFCFVAKAAPLSAFLLVSAPYLVKDIASMAAAYLLSRALLRALPGQRKGEHYA